MNVKERLLEFLKAKEISQGKFEKLVGLSNGFVNNIGDGINTTSINKITKVYPDLNTAWLLTGQGDMLHSGVDAYAIKGDQLLLVQAKPPALSELIHGDYPSNIATLAVLARHNNELLLRIQELEKSLHDEQKIRKDVETRLQTVLKVLSEKIGKQFYASMREFEVAVNKSELELQGHVANKGTQNG